MSYDARVFQVMIASPSDVKSEREIVRDVIADWNAVHSVKESIALMPVGWDTHSTPEMGNAPQDILNKQLLKHCDLLVGIFGHRIGTATTEYESGTVEEIKRHMAADKPAMVYFSDSSNVNPRSIDLDQLKGVRAFEDWCKPQGLYRLFKSLDDFRNVFFRNLQSMVNTHEAFKKPPQKRPASRADISAAPRAQRESADVLAAIASTEAKQLILVIAADKAGAFVVSRTLDGTSFSTNTKNLGKASDRRELVKWERHIRELLDFGLITSTGSSKEYDLHQITDLGYELADLLESGGTRL